MIGGLWNGLSGLNSFDRALSVESNNITNVNTVGYKSDEIKFEDLMYDQGYGKGSNVERVDKSIVQGSINLTGNTYDVGIEGKGYFIVEDRNDGEISYTRAGNFQMAIDGVLQTENTEKVLGLTPQTTTIISSDDNEQVFTSDYNQFISSQLVNSDTFTKSINTRATNYLQSAQSSGISGDGYKSADAKVTDIDLLISNYNESLSTYASSPNDISLSSISQISSVDYSSLISNLVDESDSLNILINNSKISQQFDTDIETTLNSFSDKISNIKGLTSRVDDNGVVEITSLIPGKSISLNDASVNGYYTEIIDTQIASVGAGQGLVDSSRTALKNALEAANAKLIDITSTISLANEKELNVNEIQMKLDNLNLVENSFGTTFIEDGNIYLKDGNNSFLVGKLETATFKNEQGLIAQGDNLYKSSEDSGNAIFAGDMNELVSSSLELSNASVSNSLSSLLIYQKAYEANSKSITTSDEMLSTAMDLIK